MAFVVLLEAHVVATAAALLGKYVVTVGAMLLGLNVVAAMLVTLIKYVAKEPVGVHAVSNYSGSF
jgi:hypothetical protein